MGVSKCFSPWFTVPSEQGWTDWSGTSHCKTPHNWRAFLLPTDFISPCRKLGQGQNNLEVLHSWYLCLLLVTWRDRTETDGLYHHCRAGHAMPDLSLLLWCESSLCFCTDPDTSARVLPSWPQGCTSVWPCVHSMHSWEECLGCSKGPTNIFRMHTWKCQPTTVALTRVKN